MRNIQKGDPPLQVNRQSRSFPDIIHTAPSGRRLSEQTGSPNLICAPPIERRSQVIGALGVSCAVALAQQALSTHSYSVGPTVVPQVLGIGIETSVCTLHSSVFLAFPDYPCERHICSPPHVPPIASLVILLPPPVCRPMAL